MGAALWACLAVWTVVVSRLRQGLAVVAYQARRLVPWRGIDLLAVLVFYLAAQVTVVLLARAWLGPKLTRPWGIQNAEQSGAGHMVTKLLAEGDAWTLLLCGLSAAAVAPIVEEFLFRVVLQGWLESAGRRWRRAMPTLRRVAPGAVGPILLTSLLFARGHFRVDTPPLHVRYMTFLMVGNAAANLMAAAFAIGLLRSFRGATAVDLGWVPEKFLADVRLGLVAFCAVAAPIYGVQLVLVTLLPRYLAPDPFTLFLFALALGVLYHRTHRVVPAIVLHMALNATSLAMVLLATQK